MGFPLILETLIAMATEKQRKYKGMKQWLILWHLMIGCVSSEV
jgi:hypothetical protein